MADEEYLRKLARRLIAEGKLIEGGWIAMRLHYVSLSAGKDQLDQMRTAFFAGAQHLFGSIVDTLDPDADPTPADLERMDKIATELMAWRDDFARRHGIPPETRQ